MTCLPLLPAWELPLKQQQCPHILPVFKIIHKLLQQIRCPQGTGVSLAKDTLWEVAWTIENYGKVYLFHCGNFRIPLGIKASQSVTSK